MVATWMAPSSEGQICCFVYLVVDRGLVCFVNLHYLDLNLILIGQVAPNFCWG